MTTTQLQLPLLRRATRFQGWHLVGLLTALVATGCGANTDGMVEVHGTASFNGKRIMNGDIRFFPAAGTVGRSTGAAIVDGTFTIERNGGVPIGEHWVKVRAFILEDVGPIGNAGGASKIRSGRSSSGEQKGGKMPIYRADGRQNYIPNQFNDQTELKREITGDPNPQSIDFDLTGNVQRNSGRRV